MLLMSAPSAKILMRRRSSKASPCGFRARSRPVPLREDDIDGLGQVLGQEVRSIRPRLFVVIVYEDRPATCGFAGSHVAPAVPYHEALPAINSPTPPPPERAGRGAACN